MGLRPCPSALIISTHANRISDDMNGASPIPSRLTLGRWIKLYETLILFKTSLLGIRLELGTGASVRHTDPTFSLVRSWVLSPELTFDPFSRYGGHILFRQRVTARSVRCKSSNIVQAFSDVKRTHENAKKFISDKCCADRGLVSYIPLGGPFWS